MNDAEIEQFSKEHGFAAWYRVSAKEGTQGSVLVVLIMMLDTVMITSIDDEPGAVSSFATAPTTNSGCLPLSTNFL